MSQAIAGTHQRVTKRMQTFVTILNLHFAGVALLALVNLYLLVHMAFAWQSARTQDAAAIAQQTKQMNTAEQAAQPLRGLDGKLVRATANADSFYQQRLPFADSQVIAELGALAKKQGVKLSRVQYGEAPVLAGAVGAVTQRRIDASLVGEYRPLVVFMNSLERDRLFFLISGVTLNGQQSGTVNLRIKLTTYLRAPVGNETSAKVVSIDDAAAAVTDGSEVPQ